MEQLELNAAPRTLTGKKVKRLRRAGMVPGVLYGSDVEAKALKFDQHEVESVVMRAGSSRLIQVNVSDDDEVYMAIVRDVQRDIFKQTLMHVDLQALNMQETVRLPISINLVGEAPGVEEMGGVLLQQIYEVEVECLPADLIPFIEVDVSSLTEIGDAITVGDLDIPENITVFADPDEVVVQITFIAEEEIEEEAPVGILFGEAAEVAVVGEEEEEEGEIPEEAEAEEAEEGEEQA
ncbi:MAG: 50S ribosomal protein L25 [Anaerolineae bacterium]